MAALQIVSGLPYVFILWALRIRKAPKVNLSNLKTIFPVAMAHCFSHLGAVVSLCAGAVGFVQIIKAAEPLFTATLGHVFLGQVMPLPVYLTLLPVVAGVGLASLKEISFSALAMIAAMCSNMCSGTRSVLGKKIMGTDIGKNMDAGNLYAVMTMMAVFVLFPLAGIVEGGRLAFLWERAISSGSTGNALRKNILLSGLFFYMYNEVAFYCLNAIHPLTHGIGNTIKRIVMIAVSVVAFKHKFTPLGMLGSMMAIGGVMLYSLVKGYYDEK
eukprot:CAMPEP_0171452518 /NCGR_PEP_ID=MMETSP0945-20130129/593_1 /TAXON_ID=109269 /ORGANISM="Vaucheria litorea, Strain CCMP2940" /LENGTH=270 /DNA_ID=CAMNT_0011977199 /DNA_START=312 /DNA_END=1121 /DNA_ORIENTATION=-